MNKKLIWYILIFILVLFGFRFSCYDTLSGLDLSWIYALNDIHLKGVYTMGKDVFFTFGPFGYLTVPFSFKEVLVDALLFKIFTIVMFLFSLFCFQKREKSTIFLALLTLDIVLFGFEGYEFLAVLLAMVCLFVKNIKSYIGLIFLNTLAFFMLFAKFNIGICCVATLIFTLIALKFKRNFIMLSTLFWGIAISCITYFYFGDFNTLFNWFSKSLIIASGYSEAMLLWRYVPDQLYLLSALIIIGLYFSLWIDDYKNDGKYSKVFLIILPSMFFMFKSGFVRADLHMLTFFVYILAVVPLLYLFVKNISLKKLILMYVLALILPIQYISFNSIFSVISNFKNRSIYISNDYLLPNSWLEKIKDSKVEILPFDFSYLPKNNLIPHYNPILQLYAVYTKNLDEFSAENYKQKNTDFIIIDNVLSIDKRNLIFDTPATWDAIKANYYVEDFKSGKILLAKKNIQVVKNYKVYRKEKYNLNKDIKIPEDAKKVIINLDLSTIGKLQNFLFKLLPLYLYVNYDDGKVVKFRQVRDVMKNGLYVDELIFSMKDLNHWLKDEPIGRNINSIKLYTVFPFSYKNSFTVEWLK